MIQWKDNPKWRDGIVCSSTRAQMWAISVFALIWNAFTFPMVWLVAVPEFHKGNQAALLMLLFVAAGLWLAWSAGLYITQYRRFGNSRLQLDPLPGSVGGDVGGRIDIRLPYRSGRRFDVSLSCIQVRISRSSKKSTRHEQVVWRERGEPQIEPSSGGTRLRFKFPVPDGLPPSEAPSDHYHQWIVHVSGALAGRDLDQTFEIPVVKTGEPLRAAKPAQYTSDRTTRTELPAAVVRMRREGNQVELAYPAKRNRRMGLTVSIFGAIFLAAGVFLFSRTAEYFVGEGGVGAFAGVVTGFMTLVFGTIGALIVVFGLYELGNKLVVRVSHDSVTVVRRVFGIGFSRSCQTKDIERFTAKITSQMGQGATAVIRYGLYFHLGDGRKLCAGDGIPGTVLMKSIVELVEKAAGIGFDSVETRKSGLKQRHKRTL